VADPQVAGGAGRREQPWCRTERERACVREDGARVQSVVAIFRRSRKGRPTTEFLCEWGFRPAAHLVVLALLPMRVAPVTVVLSHFGAGVAAAVLLAEGRYWEAAVLLQVKTVLDNADGQLARASGRISELGRYLDTECDFLVNVALVAAIAVRTDSVVLALVAFPLLTVVLSVDFGLERLYKRELGQVAAPPAREGRVTDALMRAYDLVLGPQDRLVERVAEARLGRLLRGVTDPVRVERARRAYHDHATLAVLVNFGLSTQLAVLGLCLALGRPEAWLWVVVACAASLPVLYARRELRARAALR
jgi:archaetidylinositol phosphate synthase